MASLVRVPSIVHVSYLKVLKATSSMAKVHLVPMVRDIHEDWRAAIAREGKIGTSWEGTFTAKGGRTVLQCGRGSQAVWEKSCCLRGCTSGREEGN